MCRFLPSVLVGLGFLSVAAEPPAAPDAPSSLKVGSNLPGPLHPYNVTGPRKGKFHSLIADYGTNPVVMIMSRDLEVGDPFKQLLQGLDQAIDKNPALRLGCFVVFLDGNLNSVVEEDDKRDEAATKLEDQAKEAGLKNVVFTLDSKDALKNYGLEDQAAVTVVLYRKYRIEQTFSLTKDQLTEAKVKEILAAVATKLGAKKK